MKYTGKSENNVDVEINTYDDIEKITLESKYERAKIRLKRLNIKKSLYNFTELFFIGIMTACLYNLIFDSQQILSFMVMGIAFVYCILSAVIPKIIDRHFDAKEDKYLDDRLLTSIDLTQRMLSRADLSKNFEIKDNALVYYDKDIKDEENLKLFLFPNIASKWNENKYQINTIIDKERVKSYIEIKVPESVYEEIESNYDDTLNEIMEELKNVY